MIDYKISYIYDTGLHQDVLVRFYEGSGEERKMIKERKYVFSSGVSRNKILSYLDEEKP